MLPYYILLNLTLTSFSVLDDFCLEELLTGGCQMVIFLIPVFLLHLLLGILLKGRAVFFPSIYLFVLVWIYGVLFYLIRYNPLLSLFVLILKLSLIWPVGTLVPFCHVPILL